MFDGPTKLPTVPTPQEIAAGVARTTKHEAAESRLGALRELRTKLLAQYGALFATSDEAGKVRQGQAIAEADRKNAAEIRECRLDLAPLRAAHAERVAGALRAGRADVAKRATAALAELVRH